jgi:hypothetical protein
VRSSIAPIIRILHVCNTFLTQYQMSHAPEMKSSTKCILVMPDSTSLICIINIFRHNWPWVPHAPLYK